MPLESAQICGRCLRKPPAQDLSFSVFPYQGAIRRCITAFKYQQQLQFADLFASSMASELQSRPQLPQCLVPIPLHSRRLRGRGFNQALEVASRLARQLNISCQPELLTRIKNPTSQSELSYRERKKNIRRAFASPATALLAHIALIDDVMTSGHTSAEAARTLCRQGAQIIEVWTIARAISHY